MGALEIGPFHDMHFPSDCPTVHDAASDVCGAGFGVVLAVGEAVAVGGAVSVVGGVGVVSWVPPAHATVTTKDGAKIRRGM